MAITYADLVDLMLSRAERLGLTAPGETKADAAEMELYLFYALLEIVERADIPAYVEYNDMLALTQAGKRDYLLPDTYGRLIVPRAQNKRGVYLFDTVRNVDLEYVEPNSFHRETSLAPGMPERFTVTQRTLWLFPTPSAEFTLRATYVVRATRPELDDDVILNYPTALVDVALHRLASDAGKNAQILDQARQESLARLLQGSK